MKKHLFPVFALFILAVSGYSQVLKVDFKSDGQLNLERMAFYRSKKESCTPLFLSRKPEQRTVISGRPNGRKDRRPGTVTLDAMNIGRKSFRYVKCDFILQRALYDKIAGRVGFSASADAVSYKNIKWSSVSAPEDLNGDFVRTSLVFDTGRIGVRCFRISVKPEPLKNSFMQISGISVSGTPFPAEKVTPVRPEVITAGKLPCYRLDKAKVVMAEFHARQLTSKAELQKTAFSDFWGEAVLPDRHTTFVYPGCQKAARKRGVPRLGFAYKADIEPVFDPENERVLLKFVRSSFVTEIFIDGKAAGKSVESGLPIEFDITEYLTSGKKSELFIRTTGYDAGVLDEKGRGRFPHSGRKNFGGIARAVVLERVPALRSCDLAVFPVKGKVILQSRAVNQTGRSESAVMEYLIRDKEGKTIFKTSKKVSLPAGKSVETEHHFKVRGELEFWDIGKPELYFAEAVIKSGERELHRERVRFGYRYVEIKGEDFYLNGRKVRLRGPWGHLEDWVHPRLNVTDKKQDKKAAPADTYLRLMKYGMNCGRLHRQIFPPEYYSGADEAGFLIIAESAFGHVWLPEKEVAAHLERFTKNFRNHPSIVVWSASNEFQLWVTPRPQNAMDFLNRMDAVIKKHDKSGRPVQHSGFGDANGRSDICNVHYSCALEGLPRRFYWTRDPEKLTRHSYHDNFNSFNPKGRKPLFYGEHFNAHVIRDMHSAESGEPGLRAFYSGAYDSRKSQLSQVLTGNVWRGHIRAAREQNVAMIAPIVFYCGVESEFIRTLAEEFKPRGAYPVFPMPVFAAGEKNTRRFAVFEDDGYPLKAELVVTLAGKKQHQLARRQVALAGGVTEEFDLALDIPDETGEYLLVTTLVSTDGRTLYTDRVPVKLRRRIPQTNSGVSCSVWGNSRPIAGFAAKHGVTLRAADPDKLGDGILLIMPDVPEEELASRAGKLASFISSGGRVLFFERRWNKNILPGNISFSQWDTGYGRGFVRYPDHPILAGMSDRDFYVWRKDFTLADQGMIKSSSGNIKVLVDGAIGLEQAFLWEMQYGRGRAVVTHLPLAESCMTLLQSEQLLLNILKSFSNLSAPLSVPGILGSGTDDFAASTFRKLGCSGDISGGDLFVVTGTAAEKYGAAKVAECAAKYRRVMLLNVPEKLVGSLTSALGAPELKTAPVSRKNRHGKEYVWFTGTDDPVYRGISSGDLAWNSGILPEYAFKKSSGWKQSVSGGRDACATGKNGVEIRFLNLAFDRDVSADDKKIFFASQLLNNSGCRVAMRQASDRVSRENRYFYVDLSGTANASRDKIIGDFPCGKKELAGIPFLIPAESRKAPFAMLRLTGRAHSMKGELVKFDTPWDKFDKFDGKAVIPLSNPQFESVSFLLTSGFNWKLRPKQKGSCVAIVKLTYRDGTTYEAPLSAGREVPEGRKISAELSRGEIVVQLPIIVNAPGEKVKIGVSTILNPHPEKKISRFEIRAADNPPYDLMIFAITCERTSKEYI